MDWIIAEEGFLKNIKEDVPILLMLGFPYMINPGQVYFQIAWKVKDKLHYEGRFQIKNRHFPDSCLTDEEKTVFLPYVKAYIPIEIDSYNTKIKRKKKLQEFDKKIKENNKCNLQNKY